MEILRNYNQISSKVEKIFNIGTENLPLLDPINKVDLEKYLEGARVGSSSQEISGLAELIFQLNNYLPALCNFIKMFLITKNYSAIVYFMEKLFVAHVGTSIYVSKNKQYSHKERFFDRFIEVVKNTDLTIKDILPFLFAIIQDNDKTAISTYLAPCLEYMQNIYRENMDVVAEFVAENPNLKITYFELGLEFNTQKAIMEIFNADDGVIEEKLIAKILKYYYKDTMAFFDKHLENSGDKKWLCACLT